MKRILALLMAVKRVFVRMCSGRLRKYKAGGTVFFGHYEQEGNSANGAEAIEWKVLDVQGDMALLISRYAIDAKPYNTERADVTWETCSLRKWLNDTFCNKAFTDNEKNSIVTTTVTADKNPNCDTDPGNDVQDKVFLLSIDEANRYFKDDEARMCAPTAYAKKNGLWQDIADNDVDTGTCWWWLRSPGYDCYDAALVDYAGSTSGYCSYVSYSYQGVRPCIWVRVSD